VREVLWASCSQWWAPVRFDVGLFETGDGVRFGGGASAMDLMTKELLLCDQDENKWRWIHFSTIDFNNRSLWMKFHFLWTLKPSLLLFGFQFEIKRRVLLNNYVSFVTWINYAMTMTMLTCFEEYWVPDMDFVHSLSIGIYGGSVRACLLLQ
jgi:hypothetical protein